MKNSIFVTLAFLVFNTQLKAQDYLKTSQIYLNMAGRNIPFNEIKLATIHHLVGKPVRVQKDFNELVNEASVEYIYSEGSITFETKSIAFIEINKPGWGFTFKINNQVTPIFAVGTDISQTSRYFPHSFLKKGEHIIRLEIKDCDCAVVFEIAAGKVKTLSFFTDES